MHRSVHREKLDLLSHPEHVWVFPEPGYLQTSGGDERSTAGVPISMSAHTACSLIRTSSSFRAAMSEQSIAVLSPAEKKQRSRVLWILILQCSNQWLNCRTSFISPSVSAACHRIWGFHVLANRWASPQPALLSHSEPTPHFLSPGIFILNEAMSGSIAGLAISREPDSIPANVRVIVLQRSNKRLNSTDVLYFSESFDCILSHLGLIFQRSYQGSTALSSFILTGLIDSPFIW